MLLAAADCGFFFAVTRRLMAALLGAERFGIARDLTGALFFFFIEFPLAWN
jgi:hypothetical protein